MRHGASAHAGKNSVCKLCRARRNARDRKEVASLRRLQSGGEGEKYFFCAGLKKVELWKEGSYTLCRRATMRASYSSVFSALVCICKGGKKSARSEPFFLLSVAQVGSCDFWFPL